MGLWILFAVIAFAIFGIVKFQMDNQSKERIRNQIEMHQQSSQMKRSKSNFELKKITPLHIGGSGVSAKTYDGWITVKAGDELELQIPPTMELQSEDYQKNMTPISSVKETGSKVDFRIVAQQKGLNDNVEEAYSHYVRAVLKIISLPTQTFKWGERIEATKQELKEINDSLISSSYGNLIKLVSVSQTTQISDVNNIPCLYTRYETQYENNPIVINEIYLFFNGRKCYSFLTMIRSTEYEYWTSGKNDVRAIVKTIRPNDI